MNTEQDEQSGRSAGAETLPLTLRPLTPDEWERNQALCDALLKYVFDVEP